MRRVLLSVLCGGLLLVVSSSTAFATATLELVSGGDTLYVTDTGSILCTGGTCASFTASGDNNPLPGVVSISAGSFNGWNISLSSGSSNSPNCNGGSGVGCINNTNINAHTSGAGTLSIYFADTNFATEQGFVVGLSSTLQTGKSVTQNAYAFTGVLPLGSGVTSPVVTGLIGSPLTILSGVGGNLSTGGLGLSGPFDLLLYTTFVTDAGGGGFVVGGNIAAVPEPAALLLLGTVLTVCSSLLRKRYPARS